MDYAPLVPKFVAVTFAPIAASVRRLHEEYLAAEVKRQRTKEIVPVVQVAHAHELRELDVLEWPLRIQEQEQKQRIAAVETACPVVCQGRTGDRPLCYLRGNLENDSSGARKNAPDVRRIHVF